MDREETANDLQHGGARPDATQAQIQLARRLCSELHYAFYARPARTSRRWRIWDVYWTDALYELCTLLASAKFLDLPKIALAAVYRCNKIGAGGGNKFEFESIHPAYANQPSTDPPPGMERLDYNATNYGQVSLIAEGELPVAWWTDGGAERPADMTYPGESFSNEATEGVHAGLAQTTEAAVMPRMPDRDEEGADSTVSGGEMDVGGLEPSNPIGSAALSGSGPMDRGRPMARDLSTDGSSSSTRKSLSSTTAERQRDETGPLENRKRRWRDGEGPHGVKDTVPPEEGFPPQPIPHKYLRLDKGCDNCAGIDGVCYWSPFEGSICERCHRRKRGCSLSFGDRTTPREVSGYLAWCHYMQVTEPETYGAPSSGRVPPEWPSLRGPVPSWFKQQFDARPQKLPGCDYPRGRAARSKGQATKGAVEGEVRPRVQDEGAGGLERLGEARVELAAGAGSGGSTKGKGKAVTFAITLCDEHGQLRGVDVGGMDVPPTTTVDDVASADAAGALPMDMDGVRPLSGLSSSDNASASHSGKDSSFGTRGTRGAQSTSQGKGNHAGQSTRAAGSRRSRKQKEQRIVAEHEKSTPEIDTWRDTRRMEMDGENEHVGVTAELCGQPTVPNPCMEEDPTLREGPVSESMSAPVPPTTPPSQVFHLGELTQEILAGSVEKAWHAEELDAALKHTAIKLQEVRRAMDTRRVAVRTCVAGGRGPEDMLAELVHQTSGAIDDYSAITVALEGVITICAAIRRNLNTAMAVHPYFGAMVEMVETLNRVRALYSSVWERFAAVDDSLAPLGQRVEQLTEKVDGMDTMPEAYNRVIQAKLEALQERVRGDIARLRSEMEARNAGSREGGRCYRMASTCEMVVDEARRDSDEGCADTPLGIHEALAQLQRRVDALSGLGAANTGWGLENGGIRPSDAEVRRTAGPERQPAAQAMNGMEVTQRLSSLEDRVRSLEDKVTDAALHARIQAYLEKVGFRTIHAPVD